MTYYRAPQNKQQHKTASPENLYGPETETRETFPFFPAFVHVTGKKVIVLGGGEVAAGKLRLLLRSQADITVIAPELCTDIATMVDTGAIRWEAAPFVDTMLNGAVMIFDAADDMHLTRRVKVAAKRRNILLNVVDKTEHCDFIVPAILDRAPVMVTISTGGCAPALARIIRQRLETTLPASMSQLASLARSARRRVAAHLPDNVARQRFWTHFFQNGLQDTHLTQSTQRDLDAALARFVPEGSSATVPGGQILHADVAADNAYDLAHGIARAIETSDIIFHMPGIAPDILGLARRDATVIELESSDGGNMDDDARERLKHQAAFFARQGSNITCLYRN
ncbi:siroheme synthase [Thalassospiraceae bacterium SW-3-3]|nr:siroheme synthase [Thalassospiraceae bacterium SW-3-3]